MIRGLYIGASGMRATQVKMDVVANNLANVDKTAFKRDSVIYKTFPELLIHRTNDDGIGWSPMGSFDTSPLVGKLGTGVEVNELHTNFSQGPVKHTNKETDLAINGNAFFVIATNHGNRLSRNGAFTVNEEGHLVTSQGFPLLGESGFPLKVKSNNFLVKPNGEVWVNQDIEDDPTRIYGKDKNTWEEPALLDRIQFRTVDFIRHLDKEGASLYRTTLESGDMVLSSPLVEVQQGALEASNVNVVREMVDMIEVQRTYEMNQKSIQTHDSMLGKLINEVAR